MKTSEKATRVDKLLVVLDAAIKNVERLQDQIKRVIELLEPVQDKAPGIRTAIKLLEGRKK